MNAEKLIGQERGTTRRAEPGTRPAQTGPQLTARQWQIITVIREATERNGFAPSQREIAQAIGLSSVQHQIENLEKLGVLTRDPRSPRSCEIVDGFELPAPADAPPSSLCSLPGNGAEASGTVFVLQVVVGSAIGAAVLDGALVTVRSAHAGSDAPPGSTVLGQVVAVTHPQVERGSGRA
ncbi:LexA family protein [Streptomyces sp. QTS52]